MAEPKVRGVTETLPCPGNLKATALHIVPDGGTFTALSVNHAVDPLACAHARPRHTALENKQPCSSSNGQGQPRREEQSGGQTDEKDNNSVDPTCPTQEVNLASQR